MNFNTKQELKELPMILIKETTEYILLGLKITAIPFSVAILINFGRWVLI